MAKNKHGAGLWSYLKGAFLFRWNLLVGAAAVAAAVISGQGGVLLPLVAAAEAIYLAGMVASPRFRAAMDARQHGASSRPLLNSARATDPKDAVDALVSGLTRTGLARFDSLRKRCLEMRTIARGVGGRANKKSRSVEDMSTPGLDRLLWMFLRLLHSQAALERFLHSTDEDSIRRELEETQVKLTRAEESGDERMLRSLRDSLATRELRLDNYAKAAKNAEFVNVELDRLEGKIQTLSEMAVNRQDPDFLSREVDSVAASMQHTEQAMEELHLVDGLIDELGEAPSILEADLRGVIKHEA